MAISYQGPRRDVLDRKRPQEAPAAEEAKPEAPVEAPQQPVEDADKARPRKPRQPAVTEEA